MCGIAHNDLPVYAWNAEPVHLDYPRGLRMGIIAILGLKAAGDEESRPRGIDFGSMVFEFRDND